jgi:hypothetical protein
MKTVGDYLDDFLELGEAAFVEKFDHPFLLYPDKHGHGGFRSYHTRMADRGDGANLAGSKSLRDFQVLAPSSSGTNPTPSKLLVGRSEDRDLPIDHSTVSKRHAVLVRDDEAQAFKLGDAGSTNGTFLNGQAVESGEPVFLRDGNVVSFGDCDYLFYSPKGFVNVLTRLGAE